MLPWRVAEHGRAQAEAVCRSIALVLTLVIALGTGLRDVWGLLAFTFAAFGDCRTCRSSRRHGGPRRRAGGGGCAHRCGA
jgi:hypothetical protein